MIELKNEQLKEYAKDHTDFINGCLDLIARGRIPKHGHKTVINNLAIAHGYTKFIWPNSTEPFFIKDSKLAAFKSLIEQAVEKTSQNNKPQD